MAKRKVKKIKKPTYQGVYPPSLYATGPQPKLPPGPAPFNFYKEVVIPTMYGMVCVGIPLGIAYLLYIFIPVVLFGALILTSALSLCYLIGLLFIDQDTKGR